ncbi:MAG: biliverdin-producing heme oxygenase [Caldimonas sp.]
MNVDLAERLKLETRTLHTEAERSPFMAALLRGRMSRSAYVALLQNLHAIYATLEPALRRHAAHPAIAPFDLASLARSQSLLGDLSVLLSSFDTDASRLLEPASSEYVERLRELDARRPELLLAHAYVRYLGDLSGGQMLGPIVERMLQLPPGVGTAFYDFGDAPTTAARTTAFRSGLQAVAVDDPDELVDEAKRAFEWHKSLFGELARRFDITS